jgi:hypothetical protein
MIAPTGRYRTGGGALAEGYIIVMFYKIATFFSAILQRWEL